MRCVFALVVFSALPAIIAAGKERCTACKVVVEQLIVEAREQDDAVDNAALHLTLSGLCSSDLFQNYTDPIKNHCNSLTASDKWRPVLIPDLDVLQDDEKSYKHILDACIATKACPTTDRTVERVERVLPDLDPAISRCESCKLLCNDVQTVADRQAKLRNNDLAFSLINAETICDRVGLRHPQSSADVLEEQCNALFEATVAKNETTGAVYGNNLARLIVMRNGFTARGWQPSQSLEEKVCVELTDFCENMDQPDLTAGVKTSSPPTAELELDASGNAAPVPTPSHTPTPAASPTQAMDNAEAPDTVVVDEEEEHVAPPDAPPQPSSPCNEWRALPGKGATDHWCSTVCGGDCIGKHADQHPFPDYCRCSVIGAATPSPTSKPVPAASAGDAPGEGEGCADPAPSTAPQENERWYEQGATKGEGPITRAVIKGPVHTTCQIKQYPGLREFHKGPANNFPSVQVKGYVQPPHFLFYNARGELVERLDAPKDATSDQYVQALKVRGF